jgi:hypothetical protein
MIEIPDRQDTENGPYLMAPVLAASHINRMAEARQSLEPV